MPQLTIDGRALEFEKGESVIQVAARNEIDIPHYCWHPRLSVAANCRMCLVEVEKAPKLLPACQTECRDEMVVHTDNERVADAQRAVHEFLLVNHPIDCPICDQAGECKLQDYYMRYQLKGSRVRDDKVHKPRYQQFGPNVMYNAERCILCTRCVRFMDEVVGDRQLGMFNRGDHSEIGLFPGSDLDSAYGMNIVDVCPVGALTSVPFRFKQRVWNLHRTPSVCGGCARGCNVHVDSRSGQVYRYVPRENDDVNASWLCDEGRLGSKLLNENKLENPSITSATDDGSEVTDVSITEAMRRLGEVLGPVAEAGKGAAALMSMHCTCEDAFVLGHLLKDTFGATTVGLHGYADGDSDNLLRVADKNPNRLGVTRVLSDLGITVLDLEGTAKLVKDGSIKALLVVGSEFDDMPAMVSMCEKLDAVVHIASAASDLQNVAAVTLPAASHVEIDGTWVNHEGRAQHLAPAFDPRGKARSRAQWLLAIADKLTASLGITVAKPMAQTSPQTLRSEMERRLPAFKGGLTNVGLSGRVLE